MVRVKTEFYKDEPEYTKYFKEEEKATEYMKLVLDQTYKIPICSFIENRLGIVDEGKYYLLEHDVIDITDEVFIDFAFFQPAT